MPNFKDVKKRAERAFSRDQNWVSLLQQVYEYFLPQRDVFNYTAEGQKKDDLIFDSTAPLAMKQFANKMQEQLTPIHREWAMLQVSEQIKELVKEQNQEQEFSEHLDKVTRIAFRYINNSNFATQINEAYLDLAIGTCALTIEETDDSNIIEFQAVPQNVVSFGNSTRNKPENIYRKIKVPAGAIESTFPGYKLDAELTRKAEKNPDEEVCITVALEWHEDSFKAMAWHKNSAAWEEDYGNTSPWIVARWAVAAGELRGRGPALDVLSDVRTLNKIKEFMLQKASLDLGGMWTGTDDGGFNPYNVTIGPGTIIPVASNNNTDPSLRRLDTGGDLNLSMFEVEQLQASIKTALFNDLRDPAGPVRTATEIAIDARELAMRIGSAFGRLQSELLIPILNRVIDILSRRGLLPKYEIGGDEIGVKFTSPLARLQDQQDILAFQESVELLGAIAPEAVQIGFKIEDLPQILQEKKGFDPALVRSKQEAQQLSQQAMQAQQEQGVGSETVEQ